jgi:hypothetical protein
MGWGRGGEERRGEVSNKKDRGLEDDDDDDDDKSSSSSSSSSSNSNK